MSRDMLDMLDMLEMVDMGGLQRVRSIQYYRNKKRPAGSRPAERGKILLTAL